MKHYFPRLLLGTLAFLATAAFAQTPAGNTVLISNSYATVTRADYEAELLVLPADLRDPALARESFTALDELTRIMRLGSVYDFQH